MALSEQEQRLLAELEASLAADDPHLAHTLRGDGEPVHARPRRMAALGLGFLVGLAGLVGGLQVHPFVSVLGFIVMLISAVSISEQVQGAQRGEVRAPRAMPRSSRSVGSPIDDDHLDRARERWRQDGSR